jgi:hypothetical protein
MFQQLLDRDELKSLFTQACDDSRERLCRPDATAIHMYGVFLRGQASKVNAIS